MNETMSRLRELQPEAAAELERARRAARAEAPDEALLELCLGRADSMLTGAEWAEPDGLGERERAYLEFTEQFSLAVGGVTPDQVQGLLAHDSEEAVCAFVGALYALEMSRRVEIVGEVVFG